MPHESFAYWGDRPSFPIHPSHAFLHILLSSSLFQSKAASCFVPAGIICAYFCTFYFLYVYGNLFLDVLPSHAFLHTPSPSLHSKSSGSFVPSGIICVRYICHSSAKHIYCLNMGYFERYLCGFVRNKLKYRGLTVTRQQYNSCTLTALVTTYADENIHHQHKWSFNTLLDVMLHSMLPYSLPTKQSCKVSLSLLFYWLDWST